MAAGERARRRAEKERAAAAAAAVRRLEAERDARRKARRTAVERVFLKVLPKSRPGQSGRLAAKRRQQTVLVIGAVVAVNTLIWLGTSDWAARSLFLLLSLLVTPIAIHLATKN